MRKLRTAAALLAFCALLTGCESTQNSTPLTADIDSLYVSSSTSVTEVSADITEAPPVTEPEPDPRLLSHNPLTGEFGYNPEAEGRRPVAIMVNNIDQSLPQYGIAAADYIYEIIVEGGITRLMGVYADYTNVPNVCSVRSCRYYYPLIAFGLDAMYCHWGEDKTIAAETLDRLGIDTFSGDEGWLYETLYDNDLTRLEYYDREHTGYLNGSYLPTAIAEAGYRTELRDDHNHDFFNFTEGEELQEPPGTPCKDFSVNFSYTYISRFTFDKASGKYLKQHCGDPHMDAATGEQLGFTNVFVLETEVAERGVGYLMNVALEGGHGYYISNGYAQEINWTKPADDQNFVITDLSGNPLTVNRGKCYFGITDSISFEEEGSESE